MVDAKILAKHFIWANTPKAENLAFNVVNGDIFLLSWLWKQVAEYFGIEYQGFVENNSNLRNHAK
jgi:hypothetical protein